MTAVILGTLSVGRNDDPQAVWTRVRALAVAGGLGPVAAARLALAAVSLVGGPAQRAAVELCKVTNADNVSFEAVVRGGAGHVADLPAGLVDDCQQRALCGGPAELVARLAMGGSEAAWPEQHVGRSREAAERGSDMRALLAAALCTIDEQGAQMSRLRAEVDGLRSELDATSQGLLAMHGELSGQRAELERAWAAAVQASEAKAAFLASMSHEIRSPLNAALGFASLLQETELTADQAELTETLLGACSHLRGLLDGVLDLSKIESGLLELEEIPFDLTGCVEDAASIVAQLAEEKSVAVAAFFAPGLPETVVGDPVRVRQILVNLLANAVKFTVSGHVFVEVTAQAAGDEPHIRLEFGVHDTGPGIPEIVMARLFQPFAQADTSVTRHFGGTGLGLSITRQLAERMGGGVTVRSIPGEGSTFTAAVLLRRDGPMRPGHRPEPLLAGAQVLVVHPQQVVAEAIRRHLAAWGARAVVADSVADAALDSLPWDAFALAIVGLGGQPAGAGGEPPGGDPVRAVRALASGREQPLPVVAVTPLAWRRPADGPLAAVRTVTGTPVHRDRLRGAILDALGLPTETIAAPEQPGGESAPALHILVADDQEVNRRALSLLLNRMGHRVDLVSDGEEAVDAIAAGDYDVVLMDVQMPRLDGISATRQALSRRPGPHPPIIAITADATAQTRESCLRAGARGFLSKPVTRADLARAISEAVGRRPPAGHPQAGPARQVLYIDDNPMLRSLVERIAASEPDLALITAADGHTGLDLASALLPDVILLDLQLPDIGGERLIEELRREPRTSGIPIVVVSGGFSPGIVQRLAGLEAVDHLAKPFDAVQLKASIAAAARGRRLHARDT
jgi:signal transduction histidine kinase/CheY-like chemotaxis protein